MRKLVVGEFVSLDGVMQAPGSQDEDADGFAHGGWAWPYWHDEIDAAIARSFSEGDALLLGRKTWLTFSGAFEPRAAGDPTGDMMNAIPKYVVSTTLTSPAAWRNSTLIGGDVVERVRALKAQPGANILINGSSVLVHALAQHDLIDEYLLSVFPVVLGGGKRVFADGARLNLRLVEARPVPSGVVLTHYAVEHSA